MRAFFDSSGLAKRYIKEQGSAKIETLLAEAVLLQIVDCHGVVDRGRAKSIPQVRLRGVEEAAGVHEEILAVGVQLKAQDIVVLVVADSLGSNATARDEQVEVFISHDIDAGIRKGPASEGRGGEAARGKSRPCQ